MLFNTASWNDWPCHAIESEAGAFVGVGIDCALPPTVVVPIVEPATKVAVVNVVTVLDALVITIHSVRTMVVLVRVVVVVVGSARADGRRLVKSSRAANVRRVMQCMVPCFAWFVECGLMLGCYTCARCRFRPVAWSRIHFVCDVLRSMSTKVSKRCENENQGRG